MQTLFAAVRALHTDSASLMAHATVAEARPADGPQLLGAEELALVSGGNCETIDLPVTKW